MSVRVTDHHAEIAATNNARIQVFLRLFAQAVLASANPRTPHSGVGGGNLRRRTQVMVLGHTASIKWLAPYAEYQERGYTSGPVRRYTTPGTGKAFAEGAVDQEIKNVARHAKTAGLA